MTEKGATGDFFIIFEKKKKNSPKMEIIFLPNKQKNVGKKVPPPDWPQLWPPAAPETDAFLGWPGGNIAKDFLPREYQITKVSRLPNAVPLSLPL